ncbi:MAG: NADH-quinone oxidoreductase subunit M [Pirellulales bacterium]
MGNVLLTMILLPLIGAVLALFAARQPAAVRWIALVTTLATLALSLVIVAKFEPTSSARLSEEVMAPQMTLQATWLEFNAGAENPIKIDAYLGIDGLSLWLVLLTTLLMVSSVLVSWTAITDRVAQFYAWLLVLETGLLGVFCAFDLILFYVFFEFTLIPLFFLIGIWGGSRREYAAGKFFIYTLSGSLLSLVGLVALVLAVHHNNPEVFTFSIPQLAQEVRAQTPVIAANFDFHNWTTWQWTQVGVFLAMFAGFAIKVPLFPFHTWLPLAHVEAPTAGSVLLAGVLLKLGSYGFLRLALPLTPFAVQSVGVPLVAVLSVIGIIYGALCALTQTDMKKLVAYSSVSHLGFCMLGLFALNAEGIAGGTLQMINHGLSTGALFLLVGMLYERLHSRQFEDMGGLAGRMPIFACFLIFVSLSSMGLPGLNGFIGEILSLIGMFKFHKAYAVIGAAGIVLGAWYLLNMLQLTLFGPKRDVAAHEHLADLNGREILALAPIAVLCLAIGVFPQPVLNAIKPEVDAIAAIYDQQSAVARNAMDVPTVVQVENR